MFKKRTVINREVSYCLRDVFEERTVVDLKISHCFWNMLKERTAKNLNLSHPFRNILEERAVVNFKLSHSFRDTQMKVFARETVFHDLMYSLIKNEPREVKIFSRLNMLQIQAIPTKKP
jgi:hypothetical protein